MFAATPVPTRLLMKAACAGVILLKVTAVGLSPGIAGIVVEPPSPAATSEVKKPDSCRRRCSTAVKKKVRFLIIGPPRVAPYCARVNGGFLFGALSMIGAKALRAWIDLWRVKA